MKKNDYAIYIFIIYLILIGILLLLSCTAIKIGCPTNNSKYFFKQEGAKPTKQFIKNNR
jgi:hypothetical protein